MTGTAASLDELAAAACRPGAARLAPAALAADLALLPGWAAIAVRIEKTFAFPDYHATIAFVNAVAWIAHRQDHHPDLAVGYNRCTVAWSTHDAGGVTRNDCICAAHIERLFA
jgi:4a-hydroxytetrahydrobiopterin dehydratase